jgi:hypothetical protein
VETGNIVFKSIYVIKFTKKILKIESEILLNQHQLRYCFEALFKRSNISYIHPSLPHRKVKLFILIFPTIYKQVDMCVSFVSAGHKTCLKESSTLVRNDRKHH